MTRARQVWQPRPGVTYTRDRKETTAEAVQRFLKEAKNARASSVRRFRAMAGQKRKISCEGIGCNGCCYQMILCNVWEGALIARALLESGKRKLLATAIEQGDRASELLSSYADAAEEAIKDGREGEAPDGKAALSAWYDRHEGCAFLNPAGGCEIYGLRPVTCSTYLSVDEPARCFARAVEVVRMVDSRAVTRWANATDKTFAQIIFGPDAGTKAPIVEQPIGRAVKIGLEIWKQVAHT